MYPMKLLASKNWKITERVYSDLQNLQDAMPLLIVSQSLKTECIPS